MEKSECIIVKCTGEWEIKIDNLKKVEGIPELVPDEDMFGSRVFPYICFPDTVDKDAMNDILWWAKSKSNPLWKEIDGIPCFIYQLRMKKWYVEDMAKELFKVGGFFLC